MSNTLRQFVRLPPMPKSAAELKRLPRFDLQRASLIEGKLTFDAVDGLQRAASDGFFLLKVPAGCELDATDAFAHNFYKERTGGADDELRGFKHVDVPGDFQGYFDREHDQWENLYVEATNWQGTLPASVSAVADRMAKTGVAVLRSVLDALGVERNHWEEITGGLSDEGGHRMFAVNHFRPEKAVRGSKFHRDSGWVTILRSVEPGLVSLIGDTMFAIDPVPGFFIVNFGSSLEILTQHLVTPLKAHIHGVARTEPLAGAADRTSYVTFLDSRLDGTIYTMEDDSPAPLQSMQEFAIQEVSRTYDDSQSL